MIGEKCEKGTINIKSERISARPNNYIYNNYSNIDNDINHRINNRCLENCYCPFPTFTMQKSIDYFTLSISKESVDYDDDDVDHDIDQYVIRDILTSIGFKSIRNDLLDKGNYRNKWSFKNIDNGITAEVFYNSKKIFLPSISLKIHDPNRKVVKLLHKIFIEKEINANLSYVELTFDFFTDEKYRMGEFLKSSTFMKNARSEPGRKRTTYYLNNLRQSVRGMRIYTRPEWKHVRMEVTLKGQLLKRLGLLFPLKSIDSIDLTRFFLFRIFDQEMLQKYLIWSNRKIIKRINKNSPEYGNLLVGQINNLINSIFIDDYGRTTPLMDQVSALKIGKSAPNYSRFLVPLNDFSNDFFKQAMSQKFLR